MSSVSLGIESNRVAKSSIAWHFVNTVPQSDKYRGEGVWDGQVLEAMLNHS